MSRPSRWNSIGTTGRRSQGALQARWLTARMMNPPTLRVEHPSGAHSELQSRARRCFRRCARHSSNGRRSGSWSTAAPIIPEHRLSDMAADGARSCESGCCRKIAARARRCCSAPGSPGSGIHARADDGFRRPTPRRQHPEPSCRRPWPSPDAMVLGDPIFDASAPAVCASKAAGSATGGPISRRCGRAYTTRCSAFASIRSTRCLAVMRRQRWMRRFDFDVEAVVRLCWRGVRPINLPAPVRYFRPGAGRRLALSTTGGTTPAHLDAFPAVFRLSAAPAAVAGTTHGRATSRSRRTRIKVMSGVAAPRVAARPAPI